MRADHQLMMGRFQVTGTNGIITLAGYVVSNHQRAAAVRDAWQVKGVKVVVDNMRLVDSTRQSLTLAFLKPTASLQNNIPDPRLPRSPGLQWQERSRRSTIRLAHLSPKPVRLTRQGPLLH